MKKFMIAIAVMAICFGFVNIVKAEDCWTCDSVVYRTEGNGCILEGYVCMPVSPTLGQFYIHYSFDGSYWQEYLLDDITYACLEGCHGYHFSIGDVDCEDGVYYFFECEYYDHQTATFWCGFYDDPSYVERD
jgi:hypothetical protein